MDRNAVIATVLITAILFGWLYFFQPPAPPATSEAAVEDSLVVAAPDEAALDTPPAPDTTLGEAAQGTARLVTVDNDLYRAVFSTRGGTLVSFELKEYQKADRQTPVQMVDTAGQGAIGLAFTTPRSRNVDTRDLFFEPSVAGDTLRVAGDSVSLSFTARLGEGLLRQTYVFKPASYEVGLYVSRENGEAFMTRDGYDVVWNGGIPYAEESKEEELRRAGVYGRSGGDVEELHLLSDPSVSQTLTGRVDWVAIKSKYFVTALIPSGETEAAYLDGSRSGDLDDPGVTQDFDMRLEMPLRSDTDHFRFYIGPMEYYRIAAYDLGLYDIVDYGWNLFESITRPIARFVFIPVFTFLSTFIPNYGIIIIIFAFLIKIVTHPLQRASFRSMARMRKLQPEIEKIKEKHADDPQKQQQAMMGLYRDAGVNPLGGCLPMLLQYPVLIALWMFLPQAIQIRQQPFLWASDLSAPDMILHLPFTLPLYGNFVAGFTILMGLSLIVQMRIQARSQPANPQMQMFMYLMPVMLFVFFNKQAAGLSLYYLCYNVLSALQQGWINRQMEKEPAPLLGGAQASKAPAKPRNPRKKAVLASEARGRRG